MGEPASHGAKAFVYVQPGSTVEQVVIRRHKAPGGPESQNHLNYFIRNRFRDLSASAAKNLSVARKQIGCTDGRVKRSPAGEGYLKTPEDGEREKRFLELAKSAQTQIFEKDGDCTAESVLGRVIEADKKLWEEMQAQLAEYGALIVIKGLIKKTPHLIDDNPQLDLFPNMPRLITFKKKTINLLKATASELEWYGDWWGRRLEGLAKRTEEDLAISGEIDRLKRAMKKYDPTGTVQSALQIRNERLEQARRAREKRRTRKR